MPYNEKIHRIELAPEIRKALEERSAVCRPYFYTLYGYRFATMDKLPADIEADLRHHAMVIQNNSFYSDAVKAKRFSDIFNQAVWMASARREEEEMREIKPMRYEDELRWLQEEVSKAVLTPLVPEPWMPSSLRSSNNFHSEGILAQIHEMDNELKKDEAELKLPKKHSTHINL